MMVVVVTVVKGLKWRVRVMKKWMVRVMMKWRLGGNEVNGET